MHSPPPPPKQTTSHRSSFPNNFNSPSPSPPIPPPSFSSSIPSNWRQKQLQTAANELVARAKDKSAYRFWPEDEQLYPLNRYDQINPPIHWSQCHGCHLSNNATAGVFFVETQNVGQYVVVKGTSTICQEIFCSLLARELGMHTPHVAVIEYMPHFESKSDWRHCKHLLSGKMTHRDDGRRIVNDELIILKAKKELNRAFFMLMEYVPNAVTADEGLPDNVILSEAVWCHIGAMYMFDVLINNWDRIPGNMWDNEGNAGNILFSCQPEDNGDHVKLVLIDQSISHIPAPDNLEIYLRRVRNVIQDVLSTRSCGKESETVKLICHYFENSVGYEKEISDQDKQCVMDGLVSIIEKVSTWNRDTLETLKSHTNNMLTGSDWADVWKEGMNTIDIHFLCRIMDEFHHSSEQLRK